MSGFYVIVATDFGETQRNTAMDAASPKDAALTTNFSVGSCLRAETYAILLLSSLNATRMEALPLLMLRRTPPSSLRMISLTTLNPRKPSLSQEPLRIGAMNVTLDGGTSTTVATVLAS